MITRAMRRLLKQANYHTYRTTPETGLSIANLVARPQKLILILMAFVIALAAPLQGVLAAPGDYVWQQSEQNGIEGDQRRWESIASSPDGTKLVAVENYGYIYTSDDSGSTWTRRDPENQGMRSWRDVAISDDGTKMIVAEYTLGAYIYTSSDSGATWTPRTGAGAGAWVSVASSADGSKLVAGAYQGYVYTSADYGATWTQATSAGTRYWGSVGISPDGSRLVAGGSSPNSYIYTSSDYGATWTALTGSGSRSWERVALSPDGSSFVAATGGSSSYIYTSSDYGVNWTLQTGLGNKDWTTAIISNNDSTLIVADSTWVTDNAKGSIYTSTDSGSSWSQLSLPSQQGLGSIAVNSDGSRIVAAVDDYAAGGSIYTYTNSDWTEHTIDGARDWNKVTSSSSGQFIAATAMYPDYIYTSEDYGETWSKRMDSGSRWWSDIESSADGTRLVAAVSNGYIYTSTDSGATWTEQVAAGSRNWYSVALSADGTKIAATVYNGYIYTSTDSGTTWTEQAAAGSRNWNSIASSADGTKLAAMPNKGYIYTSIDSGITWTEQTSSGDRWWNSITSSSDGVKLAAVVDYGYIYTSTDSGLTWTEQVDAGSRLWYSIASSSDSTRLVAAVNRGHIYLSSVEGPATANFNFGTLDPSITDPAPDSIAQSTLSVTSSTCYTIDPASTRAMGPDSLEVSEDGVTILGGLAFNLTCTISGGSSDVELALGANYTDTTKLRAYKGSGTTLSDITDQVSFANKDIGGMSKTVINYSLVDGGALDEDGIANSVIVDPIYVGLLSSEEPTGDTITTDGSPTVPNTGRRYVHLANQWILPIMMTVSMVMTVATAKYRQKQNKKLNN